MEPETIDVSFGKVSDAAIAEAKAEEKLNKMIVCIPNLSMKVEKVWDFTEYTGGSELGAYTITI